VTAEQFRALACALPQSEERDHLGSPSFRVGGKIFAQLTADGSAGLVKLSLAEQSERVAGQPARYWVPAHWDKYGWTYVRLSGATRNEIAFLLERSWSLIAPRKLAAARQEARTAPA
jgi:hypothetical protein